MILDTLKSGNFTDGVGRQYIGEIGKTENGIVVVTTHLYDGRKSLPLDKRVIPARQFFTQRKARPRIREKATDIDYFITNVSS